MMALAGLKLFVRAAGRVCVWELVEEGLVAELAAHAGVVCSLAMHPTGACLLTSSVDGCIKVWQ